MMEPTTIFLIISLVTAAGKPNIEERIKEPTIEQCFADAKEFLASKPPKIDGIEGRMAACIVPVTGNDT